MNSGIFLSNQQHGEWARKPEEISREAFISQLVCTERNEEYLGETHQQNNIDDLSKLQNSIIENGIKQEELERKDGAHIIIDTVDQTEEIVAGPGNFLNDGRNMISNSQLVKCTHEIYDSTVKEETLPDCRNSLVHSFEKLNKINEWGDSQTINSDKVTKQNAPSSTVIDSAHDEIEEIKIVGDLTDKAMTTAPNVELQERECVIVKAKKVRAFGSGLSEGIVGDTTAFILDTSNSEHGEVRNWCISY